MVVHYENGLDGSYIRGKVYLQRHISFLKALSFGIQSVVIWTKDLCQLVYYMYNNPL
jgi:hypothetical protein